MPCLSKEQYGRGTISTSSKLVLECADSGAFVGFKDSSTRHDQAGEDSDGADQTPLPVTESQQVAEAEMLLKPRAGLQINPESEDSCDSSDEEGLIKSTTADSGDPEHCIKQACAELSEYGVKLYPPPICMETSKPGPPPLSGNVIVKACKDGHSSEGGSGNRNQKNETPTKMPNAGGGGGAGQLAGGGSGGQAGGSGGDDPDEQNHKGKDDHGSDDDENDDEEDDNQHNEQPSYVTENQDEEGQFRLPSIPGALDSGIGSTFSSAPLTAPSFNDSGMYLGQPVRQIDAKQNGRAERSNISSTQTILDQDTSMLQVVANARTTCGTLEAPRDRPIASDKSASDKNQKESVKIIGKVEDGLMSLDLVGAKNLTDAKLERLVIASNGKKTVQTKDPKSREIDIPNEELERDGIPPPAPAQVSEKLKETQDLKRNSSLEEHLKNINQNVSKRSSPCRTNETSQVLREGAENTDTLSDINRRANSGATNRIHDLAVEPCSMTNTAGEDADNEQDCTIADASVASTSTLHVNDPRELSDNVNQERVKASTVSGCLTAGSGADAGRTGGFRLGHGQTGGTRLGRHHTGRSRLGHRQTRQSQSDRGATRNPSLEEQENTAQEDSSNTSSSSVSSYTSGGTHPSGFLPANVEQQMPSATTNIDHTRPMRHPTQATQSSNPTGQIVPSGAPAGVLMLLSSLLLLAPVGVRYGSPSELRTFAGSCDNRYTQPQMSGLILRTMREFLSITQSDEYRMDTDWVMVEPPIGRGGQATCYLATDVNTGFSFCVKVMDRFRFSEVDLLLELSDVEGVVDVYGVLQHGNRVYILTQYIGGTNLAEFVGTFPNQRLPLVAALTILEQILEVLHAMHAKNILHNDLKERNVMIFEVLRIVLIDLGMSCHLDGLTRRTEGTGMYSAPEKRNGSGHGTPADIYAAMVTLFRILMPELTTFDLRSLSNCTCLPEDIRDLLRRGLDPNPETRATAPELLGHRAFRRLNPGNSLGVRGAPSTGRPTSGDGLLGHSLTSCSYNSRPADQAPDASREDGLMGEAAAYPLPRSQREQIDRCSPGRERPADRTSNQDPDNLREDGLMDEAAAYPLPQSQQERVDCVVDETAGDRIAPAPALPVWELLIPRLHLDQEERREDVREPHLPIQETTDHPERDDFVFLEDTPRTFLFRGDATEEIAEEVDSECNDELNAD